MTTTNYTLSKGTMWKKNHISSNATLVRLLGVEHDVLSHRALSFFYRIKIFRGIVCCAVINVRGIT